MVVFLGMRYLLLLCGLFGNEGMIVFFLKKYENIEFFLKKLDMVCTRVVLFPTKTKHKSLEKPRKLKMAPHPGSAQNKCRRLVYLLLS